MRTSLTVPWGLVYSLLVALLAWVGHGAELPLRPVAPPGMLGLLRWPCGSVNWGRDLPFRSSFLFELPSLYT
jgi:hypothetical protein